MTSITKMEHASKVLIMMLISAVALFSQVSYVNAEYLTLKYNANIGNTNGYQMLPVMGDVDNDGIQEIIMSTGNGLVSVNGETGAVEWTIPGTADSGVELVDLDNDGTPEILQGIIGPAIRAVNGDGSIRWTTQVTGNSQPKFPIIAYDIDGDGYPTIYFATEDVDPTMFSGNLDDYDGALTMLDHNGNILKSTWLYHPCWGGLALGDYNFDGKFEVYASDRRYNYNNVPSKGLQAYDASTLELLWNRGDIMHSSPTPVLADVTGDENLEIIAQKIVYSGVAVLDGATGNTIPGFDYLSKKLPTHAAGTVYDIDQDGNLEIINAVDDDSNYPKEFTVFDLVTGEIDFHPYFDYWIAWPPEAGDVTGDGRMEILVGTGNQGWTLDFPLLIYDSGFNLIQNISITGAGQLMPPKLFDADSDGLNEVVVATINGRLLVFDTQAPTPNPAPRTWVQRYSEYRRGAAEYVAPPGPQAPIIVEESPVDGSQNIPLGPTVSVRTNDYQGDLIDITFEINDGSGWQTIQSYNNQARGTYTADTESFVTESDKEYSWRVTTNDNKGHTNQKTFTFKTTPGASWAMPGWLYRKQIVIDHNKVAGDLTGFPLLVQLNDAHIGTNAQANGNDILFTTKDGMTKLSHEIESYDAGSMAMWVKTDLSSTQDTIIYLYYGNAAAASQETPTEVWDSNYIAVHHLEEASGTVIDSTSYNNDGTALNGLNQDAVGKISGADQFDGIDDRILLPQLFSTADQFTLEGWLFTGNKQGYIISQREETNTTGAFIQYFTNPSETKMQFKVSNNTIERATFTNQWHYFSGTYDGSVARLYVDNNTPISAAVLFTGWPALATLFGDRTAGDRAFLGLLDELRISNVARSEAYTKTSFNNQDNPAAFIRIGAREESTSFCIDADLDGFNNYNEEKCGVIDCDDSNPNIFPGAGETCNEIDDNCDGNIDEDVKNTYFMDFDGDGFGNIQATSAACTPPAGYVTDNTDCNDNTALAYPGAEETCDGLDNDCNGIRDGTLERDEICPVISYYCDMDTDAYLSSTATNTSQRFNFTAPQGCSLIPGDDCDDANIAAFPGADDSNCNGIDENCDGTPDNNYLVTQTNCGTGACAATGQLVCILGSTQNTCTEGLPTTEICGNGIDDNCDGTIDEDCACTIGQNRSCGSNIGECKMGTQVCLASGIWSAECIGETRPAEETCDGLDNNCNNAVDEGVLITYYRDADGDNYGDATSTTQDCTAPTGYVTDNTDCNDNSTSIHPEATDTECNGIDDNCNLQIDEGYVILPSPCMDGQCYITGQLLCTDGVIRNTCLSVEGQCSYFCGDNFCSDGENCTTCATDCGACSTAPPVTPPVVTPARRGGGGGGGSSFTNNWKCSNWSTCTNGQQTQTCTLGSASRTNKQKCTEEVIAPKPEAAAAEDNKAKPNFEVEFENTATAINTAAPENTEGQELTSGKDSNMITGMVTGNNGELNNVRTYFIAITAFIIVLAIAAFVIMKRKK